MDIDDILAEFDASYVPSGTRDVQQLTHWWITERAAPEILQYQEETVERIMERTREQQYRSQLQKIDKYALHILSSPNIRSRLSASELSYLKTHQALLNNLYLASFLRNFPESLRRLDDTAGGISMIEEPEMDTAVFLRVLKDIDIIISNTINEETGEEDDFGVSMKEGQQYIIRYSVIKGALERGEVELI